MANKTYTYSATQNLLEASLRHSVYLLCFCNESCFGVTLAEFVLVAARLDRISAVSAPPIPFRCLLLKLLQLSPEEPDIAVFLMQNDFKCARLLGDFFLCGWPYRLCAYIHCSMSPVVTNDDRHNPLLRALARILDPCGNIRRNLTGLLRLSASERGADTHFCLRDASQRGDLALAPRSAAHPLIDLEKSVGLLCHEGVDVAFVPPLQIDPLHHFHLRRPMTEDAFLSFSLPFGEVLRRSKPAIRVRKLLIRIFLALYCGQAGLALGCLGDGGGSVVRGRVLGVALSGEAGVKLANLS